MSAPMAIKDAVRQKAELLANNIQRFSEQLPHDEIYELKIRLMHSVSALPNHLVRGFDHDRRIDKIRSFINANCQLEECKSYLDLVEKMHYGDVSDLIKQVDEMAVMININSGAFN